MKGPGTKSKLGQDQAYAVKRTGGWVLFSFSFTQFFLNPWLNVDGVMALYPWVRGSGFHGTALLVYERQ
jgi:hypothetical protein